MRQLVDAGFHPSEVSFGYWLANKKKSVGLLDLDAKKLRKEYQQA